MPADGKYITGTRQRVTVEGAAKSRRVSPGDFVLSNSMSFGRPYISKINGYIHDGWLAISAFEASFAADYLYYLLRSRRVQDDLRVVPERAQSRIECRDRPFGGGPNATTGGTGARRGAPRQV